MDLRAHHLALVAAAVTAIGCSPAASSASRPAPSVALAPRPPPSVSAPPTVDPRVVGVDLPGADHAARTPPPEGPVVAVVGGEVRLDGKSVTTVAQVGAGHEPRPIERLFDAVHEWRAMWDATHGGGASPEVTVLAFEPDTPAFVVKSVVQTMVLAGFRKLRFAVSEHGATAYFKLTAPLIGVGPVTEESSEIAEAVRSVVRGGFADVRRCYEAGLARDPKLAGETRTRVVIAPDGRVTEAADAGSTLADPAVVACVTGVFGGLRFPRLRDEPLTVIYPLRLRP